MSNKTISALTAATVPLAGSELVPLWDGTTTKKVAVSDLTSGRDVDVKGLRVIDTLGAVNIFGTTAAGFRGNYYRYTVADANVYGSDAMNIDTGEVRHTAGFAGWGGYHSFYANGVNQMLITSAEVKVLVNNLTIGTAAKGINFTANTPAAGMTSQLLNWYEEGTWTPNQGAGLTVVGAFSSSGTYTRVGRQITVRGQVVGATSVAVVAAGVMSSNLPFAASVSHAGSMFNSAVTTSGVVQITASSVVAATTIAATPNITFTATYTV